MNNTNHDFVKIDFIINRIMKHPLLKDTNPEDVNDLVIGALRMANLPGINIDKTCVKAVDCHMAVIPKEAIRVKSVAEYINGKTRPMIYNGNTSRLSKETGNTQSYTFNAGYIQTSMEKGHIEITYETFKLDEEGVPMIPKSETLFRMLDAHVKVNVFTVLFDLGKLPERSLVRVEQEYYFYAGKLDAEYKGFKNEDHMESFINQHTRTFPVDDRKNGYESSILKTKK